MQDFVSALDQLNTSVFTSADEVLELVDQLNEDGLTFALGADGQPIQVTDLALLQDS